MDIINALFRCLVFYIVIAISYRVMGKREVGELSIMDFIVSIFLAQLASISIENLEDNIFSEISDGYRTKVTTYKEIKNQVYMEIQKRICSCLMLL